MNTPRKNSTSVILALVCVVVLVGAVVALGNMPDRRTPGEKLSEATHQLADGNLKEAGRALEDRTPREKIGDAVKDVGDDIKK